MKLTEALKQLLGLTAQVNAKLDKISAPPAATSPATGPKSEGGDHDGDDDDDDDDDGECADCEGTGKCSTCGGSGKMEGDADADAKACSHTQALVNASKALNEANTKVDAHANTIKDLQGKLEAANKQVSDLTAENAKLKEDLANEKKATTAAIAASGVPADKLPEQPADPKSKTNAWDRYCALMETNPQAGGLYYMENKDAVLKAREEALKANKV